MSRTKKKCVYYSFKINLFTKVDDKNSIICLTAQYNRLLSEVFFLYLDFRFCRHLFFFFIGLKRNYVNYTFDLGYLE